MKRRTLEIGFPLLALIFGCKAEPAMPEPVHVSGLVTVGGRPAVGAYVRFHRVGDAAKSSSPEVTQVDANGAFRLAIRPGAGEYTITVCWPSIEYTEPGQKGEMFEGADRLKGRYDRADKPAATVVLQAGENAVQPLALQIPPP